MVARLADALPPQLLLVVSRGLQAMATPVVALLITTAASLGARAETAISFCNVLFVGNLCASFVVLGHFGPRRIAADLRALSARLWLEVAVFAGLAALLSTLIFLALQTTTVTNAVLLARLGPLLYALGSALFLGMAIGRGEWLGFGLIGLGLAATVFTSAGFAISRGDVLILASAGVYALLTLLGKHLLAATEPPAVVFARNFFSSIVFFTIALVLFGPEHFMDAFYGPLWAIMAVYALVVIVLAQLAFYRAIDALPPASVARWTFMTPVLAVGYAFVLNGERPGVSQLAALTFITAGLLVSALGRRTPRVAPESPEASVAAS